MPRLLLLVPLLISCAGSTPAPQTPDQTESSYAERTRKRWEREEQARQEEERRRSFTTNSPTRGAVQP